MPATFRNHKLTHHGRVTAHLIFTALHGMQMRSSDENYQSINQFISRHSTEARAAVRLCRIKEKCLATDLKCVNGWSSSTVQWKRVPKSRSSKRETTCSSVQVLQQNWQKLLCGWSQQANYVCPSVCLSVRQHLDCDKTEERSVQIYKRSFSLVFWEEEWLVGATPSTWNFGS